MTPLGFLSRVARRAVLMRLARLRRGRIVVNDADGVSSCGELSGLQASLRVHHARFFRRVASGGSLAAAEAYLRGDWDCDDLTTLFRIFLQNRQLAEHVDGGLSRLTRWGQRLLHGRRGNSRQGSRRNIAEHYDLGNDFFRLWLDETMAYSCGIFPTPETSLREASVEKFDRVCRKLDLLPCDEVLEIGAGWGGFAIHAAERYGCRVATTTISRQQFEAARQRIEAAGLADRVSLLEQDYRDLTGQFDKLVSIEMIEAVGLRYLDHFFRQCSNLLRPGGSMVLQAIVMPESRFERYSRSVDFIQRYVFPGGCLPSLSTILDAVGRSSDLRFVHAEDFSPHYAVTLRRWRQNFTNRLSDVRRLGYSEELIRLWNYYLCYCEAAFEERQIGVLQIQLDKPACRRDPLHVSRRAAERSHVVAPLHFAESP